MHSSGNSLSNYFSESSGDSQLSFVNGMSRHATEWIQQAKAALIHVVLFRRGIRCRKMIFTDGDFKNGQKYGSHSMLQWA